MAKKTADIRFVAGVLILEHPRSAANLGQITKATLNFHAKAWGKDAGEPERTTVLVDAESVDEHTAGSLEIDFLRTDQLINAKADIAQTTLSVKRPPLMFAIGRLPFCRAWVECLACLPAGPKGWPERLMHELDRSKPKEMIWYDSATDAVKRA